jgi:hypothetical protein
MTPEHEAAKQSFIRTFKKPALWGLLIIAVQVLNALVFGTGITREKKIDNLWHILLGVEIGVFAMMILYYGHLAVRFLWFPFRGGKMRNALEAWPPLVISLVVGVCLAILFIRS